MGGEGERASRKIGNLSDTLNELIEGVCILSLIRALEWMYNW